MGRKNIYIREQIEVKANDIIAKRGFSGLSDMLAVLIREEHERRNYAPAVAKDAPSKPTEALQIVEGAVVYNARKRRKKDKPSP